MKKFLQNNWIILTISTAIVASIWMAIRNKATIDRNSALQLQSASVKRLVKEILSETVHGLDLGLRGFAISKEEKMLIPYRKAIEQNAHIFEELKILLSEQGYPKIDELKNVRSEVDAYITLCNEMIETVRTDTTVNKMKSMLYQDPGYVVWKKYDDFSQPLNAFEDSIYQQALTNYNTAIRYNLILQVCIAILILPALYLFMKQLRKEREARQNLLLEVEQNDRKLVFNPGTERITDAKLVIDTSIRNSQAASDFIQAMASGNYNVEWKGLNKQNRNLNKETIAGNLIDMREKLKRLKKEDEQRNWMNEGLAAFSEVVRNYQSDSKELSNRCVSFLTKHLNAQQSSLFVLEGEEPDQYLALTASYAFDRKKWIEKRIEIGVGLLGQAYLEGDVVQITDLPEDYTYVTSGLGGAAPRHLIIVPVKYDVTTVGLVEMASLSLFEEHQVAFLRKACEFLASAILNTKTTYKMKHLLEQAQVNEENMRQREEEMRQNMEELQATQEELVRKERETQSRLTAGAL
ncbi:MAG TPA: GAF domain-containing protein [Cyclobacteriaceae bacterium]|jgi:CHASE3 domain sensor protein/putative methionine-R-sulfoxide reductase with GAF domain|nr:GAF domain-containing protein [Cyclobacteriaceae bacterium]